MNGHLGTPKSKAAPLSASKRASDALEYSPGPVLELVMIIDKILSFAPFLTVCILAYVFPVSQVLLAGTVIAASVVLWTFMLVRLRQRQIRKRGTELVEPVGFVFPRVLDVGQFLLFLSMWLMSLVAGCRTWVGSAEDVVDMDLHSLCQSSASAAWLILAATFGMVLIMFFSIFTRPFVYDFVETSLPPFAYEVLKNRTFFRDELKKAAWFWVHTFEIMVLCAAVQPIWESFSGGSCPRVVTSVTSVLQYSAFLFAMVQTSKEAKKRDQEKKRIKEVMEMGVSRDSYPLYQQPTEGDESNPRGEIRSIPFENEAELRSAAKTLAGGFANEPTLVGYLKTPDEFENFMLANVRSLSHFGMVLGFFPDDNPEEVAAVIAAVPVISESREETKIFTNFESWVAHGLAVSPENFRLPTDDCISLNQLRHKKANGYASKPHIYIMFYGANPLYRGKGYAKPLMKFIMNLSKEKQMDLVLETSTASNIKGYTNYGYRLLDAVPTQKNWVLLARPWQETAGASAKNQK